MTKVRQITTAGKPPIYQLLIERTDGTFNVMEDEEQELRKYSPKRDEKVRIYRVWRS